MPPDHPDTGQRTSQPAEPAGSSWPQAGGGAHPGVRDPRSARPGDWHPIVNAMIISTCALVTLVAIAAAWTASPIGEVTEWQRWSSESSEWSFDYPEGWMVHDLSAPGGQAHVMIARSQWVRVHLITAPELTQATNIYARLDDRTNSYYGAIESVHRETADTWRMLLGGIRMDEGVTGRTVIGKRRAVWSEFRYPGGILEGDEPMTGYRATIIGPRTGTIVGAVAPTRYWNRFRPTALHMMRSISAEGDG